MRRENNVLIAFILTGFFLLAIGLNASAAEVKYDAGGRRDPFVPVQGGGDEAGGLGGRGAKGFLLEGIIYDPPASSLVLISGEAYKVGDAIGEGKIIEIQKNQITIETNGEPRTLWIQEDEQLKKQVTEA